jgi:hypothetical protein
MIIYVMFIKCYMCFVHEHVKTGETGNSNTLMILRWFACNQIEILHLFHWGIIKVCRVKPVIIFGTEAKKYEQKN